jgi:hypothetical protein
LSRELNESRQATALVTEQAETVRREANTLRLENTQLRHEIGRLSDEIARLSGYQPPQGDQRVKGAPHKGAELPPIRPSFMSDDNMTGVQYNENPAMHLSSHQLLNRTQAPAEHRVNGYQHQNEQPHANGSIYPEPSPTYKVFPPHTQQSRINGLKRPIEHSGF